MGSLTALLSESYKFIRMADEVHELYEQLQSIRICLFALTGGLYFAILLFIVFMCRRPQPSTAASIASPAVPDQYRVPSSISTEQKMNTYHQQQPSNVLANGKHHYHVGISDRQLPDRIQARDNSYEPEATTGRLSRKPSREGSNGIIPANLPRYSNFDTNLNAPSMGSGRRSRMLRPTTATTLTSLSAQQSPNDDQDDPGLTMIGRRKGMGRMTMSSSQNAMNQETEIIETTCARDMRQPYEVHD